MLSLGLIIVIILLLLGALPAWPHMQGIGGGPASGFGLVLIILIILIMAGVL